MLVTIQPTVECISSETIGIFSDEPKGYSPGVSAYIILMAEGIDENSVNITERNKRGIEIGKKKIKQSANTNMPEKESYNTRLNPKRK